MPVTLRETGQRVGEAAAAAPSRRQITIIEAGWGSSGYYSREVLERDGPKAFPIGTQMYLDHPGRFEETDRPERSVRDLAARIASTPRMQGDALVAEAEIFDVWRPVIDSLASEIGLSIRALGETEQGEADGREGPIVTALTEGISVDFVTKAGAGGKVGQLIESAREKAPDDPQVKEAAAKLAEARNVGHYFESRIHKAFTEAADDHFGQGHLTRPERIAMSSAIGDALDSFSESLTKNAPQLYQRDLYTDPEQGGTTVTEAAAGGPTQEGDMPDEKTLAALQESVSKIEARLTETETKLTEAEQARDREKQRAELAEGRLDDITAERIVRDATITVEGRTEPVSVFEGMRPSAVDRAVRAALAEAPPRGEDGKLDREKLAERARTAAKAERDYLAEHGGSPVRDLGGSRTTAGDVTDDQLAEAFQRVGGMSEAAAKYAVNGR